MMDLALLRAEIANGMYKKPLDAIVKRVPLRPASRRSARRDNRVVEARGIAAGGGYWSRWCLSRWCLLLARDARYTVAEDARKTILLKEESHGTRDHPRRTVRHQF